MKRKRQPHRTRRGAVLAMVAIFLVVLVSVTGLAVDGGRLYQERRNTQRAADHAAEAAAIELYQKHPQFRGVDGDGQARAAALAIASVNGYGDASDSTVVVNIPPGSGDYRGRPGYAQVIVRSQVARSFSAIMGSGPLEVEARAVAAGTFIPAKGSVLILEPKKKTSLQLKGKNSSLEARGDIIVNSTGKKAVKVDKKGQIVADNLSVAGTVDRKSKGLIDAEVHTGVEPTDDPYASLSAPSKGPSQNVEASKTLVDGRNTYHLQPGTYKKLNFSHNDAVHMAPGIYYVEGEVKIGGSATIFGQEVMIYAAGKKGFKIGTRGQVSITPPSDGPYEGVSLFQNRNSKAKIDMKKGTDYDINGLIYAPNAKVQFKDVTLDSGGYYDEEDESWEDDDDLDDVLEDDGGPVTEGSISAALVARFLKIDKGSRVRFNGVTIDAHRPLRGLVE